jgi:hypothetical protein
MRSFTSRTSRFDVQFTKLPVIFQDQTRAHVKDAPRHFFIQRTLARRLQRSISLQRELARLGVVPALDRTALYCAREIRIQDAQDAPNKGRA